MQKKPKTKKNQENHSSVESPQDVAPDFPLPDPDKLAQAESIAAELDAAAEGSESVIEGERPKRKYTRRSKKTAEVLAAPVMIQPDPEFEFMVTHCVSGVVEQAKNKLDWSDPGVQWKQKVGACLSRLIQRIRPMEPGPWTDLFTICGYVGIWSLSNVAVNANAGNGTGESQSANGHDGKREDVQDAGTALEGKSLFSV